MDVAKELLSKIIFEPESANPLSNHMDKLMEDCLTSDASKCNNQERPIVEMPNGNDIELEETTDHPTCSVRLLKYNFKVAEKVGKREHPMVVMKSLGFEVTNYFYAKPYQHAIIEAMKVNLPLPVYITPFE